MPPVRCSLVLVLLAPGVLWADEEVKSARDILTRGITAMGGKEVLAHRALTGISRGTLEVNAQKFPVTNEWTVQGLDQVRWSAEATLNDNKARILVVVDRDKGWIKGNDSPANPIEKQQLTPFLHGFAALRIAESLLPLTEKGWKLSTLGELKIDDKPAVGVKAERKGLPPLDLYFDKATHLPVRAEMRIKDTESMESAYVAKFAAYKKVEGRQFFTRMTVLRDDKVVLEMERGDFKAKEKVEDETFSRP